MPRLVFWTALLTFAGGGMLYLDISLPFIQPWYGKLPGDMIISKGKSLFHVPIVSSFLIAIPITTILSLIFPKRR